MGLEDDFLLEDADDEKTVEFIKNYLPQELKEKFEDDELYYFLDLIDEYYSESGILDAQPDNDGYVNIEFPYSFLWFREKWNMETLWGRWTNCR